MNSRITAYVTPRIVNGEVIEYTNLTIIPPRTQAELDSVIPIQILPWQWEDLMRITTWSIQDVRDMIALIMSEHG